MEWNENNENISEEQEKEEIEMNEEEDEDEEDERTEDDVIEDDVVPNECKHAVENSSRFSLRVMEAMRFLQGYENLLPISSVKEIVDYISKNYNNDGDLHAQVRTALKELCSQGFVEEALRDEYQLIGPFGSIFNYKSNPDHSESSSSTPKCMKLRSTLIQKSQKRSRCRCKGLNDESESGIKEKELMIFSDKDNTLLATPPRRLLRSTLRDNNSRTGSVNENMSKCERSNHDIKKHNHNDKSCDCTSKRVRKTNDDIADATTDRTNGNPYDSIFQEIKNSTPNTSKTRDKELKKWIQRCRRECERNRKK